MRAEDGPLSDQAILSALQSDRRYLDGLWKTLHETDEIIDRARQAVANSIILLERANAYMKSRDQPF
jgi:hypothetical protein